MKIFICLLSLTSTSAFATEALFCSFYHVDADGRSHSCATDVQFSLNSNGVVDLLGSARVWPQGTDRACAQPFKYELVAQYNHKTSSSLNSIYAAIQDQAQFDVVEATSNGVDLNVSYHFVNPESHHVKIQIVCSIRR